MATTDPIRDEKDVAALLNYYKERGQLRNYCLISFGLYSALRVGDTLLMTWGDVFDFGAGTFNKHVSLIEQKTGKFKKFLVNGHLADALSEYKAWLESEGETLTPVTVLFVSQKGVNRAISRQQAYRIIKAGAKAVNIEGVVGCHSLRKTFGYNANKQGVSPTVIMSIFNHTSLKTTFRYLGIEQDDRDAVYGSMSFNAQGKNAYEQTYKRAS